MRSSVLILLFCWLCAGVLPAQAPAPLAAAIAALQSVDRSDAMAYGNALRRVAAHAHEEATATLLTELDRAGDDSLRETVVRALGQRPRDGAFEPLRKLLLKDASSDRLRRAAAEALGRQGSRGIDLLLDIAGNDVGSGLRDACIEGLGVARDERASRGLASLGAAASGPQRLRILQLLDGQKGIEAVTRLRLLVLDGRELPAAALAFRQLAAEDPAAASDKLDDLLARAGREPPVAVRADLLRGMAPMLRPDLFEDFVHLAADETAVVRQATREAAASAAANADFVRWLCAEGLSLPHAERAAVVLLLRHAPKSAVTEVLQRVRAALKKPGADDLQLALSLHEVLRQDPSWVVDVLALAKANDPGLRTAGLQLLLEMESADGIDIAQQSVAAKAWELRSVAYRYLGQMRDVSSIPLLIARVGHESGRLDQELNDSLFLLTGRRFFQRAYWERWWRSSKDGFALPPRQAVENSGSKAGGGTISYFDIPLVSNRVAFLLDISGSMMAQFGTDKKYNRLDEAKAQLRKVVEAIPERFACNLVIYETSVRAVWDRLQKAKPKQKQELLSRIVELRPTGGTNIHGALKKAFDDPDVDTIYLLTDGQPSAGQITDIQELADEVRRWNRTRQIVIHGIAIGMESVLLKRLAAESGGSYVFRR